MGVSKRRAAVPREAAWLDVSKADLLEAAWDARTILANTDPWIERIVEETA